MRFTTARILLIIIFSFSAGAQHAMGQEAPLTLEQEPQRAIPASKAEKEDLKERIRTRQQELNENKEYLQKLWTKFDQIKAKYTREKSEKARSEMALRIVRQTGRVESDKLKVWYLEQVLLSSDKGFTSDKDPRFVSYLRDGYRVERTKTLQAMDAIFAKMDKEITDTIARKSFEQLMNNYRKEVED